MLILSIFETTLPLTNPVLKFLVILIIILSAPILLNKLKIPHILGLIIAGAVVGPNGFNLILRDGGIILSGTAGLLYIMFLAGLEINISDFKKNSSKSILFGLYTFTVPMVLGILAGLFLLDFSVMTSVLLASMFASHTLISYPILSRLGVTKIRAVTIAVGGTLITDTLALLVLAIVVGMATGEVNPAFWTKLTLSLTGFALVVMLVFPIIGRWFLKRFSDNVSQYIFVLVMVFLGAVLAEAAGVEAIIGAFLAGLALNRLIPSTSPLMNRIDFVGNAVFIPFFLIGVGMLLDYRVFFQGFETLKVAAVMTVVATVSKFIAAWLTQKSFRLTVDERSIIFGLSNAQAAATLAAVLVGYNIVTGYTESGEPIRLLNESILNGTIIMILITCTIATFVTQKGGENISIEQDSEIENDTAPHQEKILIPLLKNENIDELIHLSTIIKSKENTKGLYALKVLSEENGLESVDVLDAKKILENAAKTTASVDIELQKIFRVDIGSVTGISNVVKEQGISDIILGLSSEDGIVEYFNDEFLDGILGRTNATTLIYKPSQPISTIKRHLILVPRNAEREIGFALWLAKIWNLSRNTGARVVFYANPTSTKTIQKILRRYPIEATFKPFENWYDFLIISRDLKPDDGLIIVMSREKKPSFHKNMLRIPNYLSNYFQSNSVILIYPVQIRYKDPNTIDLNNASLLETMEMFDEFGKTFSKLFKGR